MLIILALVAVFLVAQLVPDFLGKGFVGVNDHIKRVAIAGVPPEHWPAAVSRMYGFLAILGLALLTMYLVQLCLGKILHDMCSGNGPKPRL